MGVSHQFPIDGVVFILGNDLAEGKVLVNPEVTAVPSLGRFDYLEQKYPEVFSVFCCYSCNVKKPGSELF